LMIALFALALGLLATYTNSAVDENGDIVVNGKTVNYNDYKPAVEGYVSLTSKNCRPLMFVTVLQLYGWP